LPFVHSVVTLAVREAEASISAELVSRDKENDMHTPNSPSGMTIPCGFVVALALALGAAWFGSSAVSANGDGTHGFRLGGTAQHAYDPENPANDVIKIDTTSPDPDCNPMLAQDCLFGTVSRTLNTRIAFLDNMVEFKAYFKAPRGCGGGSPRIQLAIDLNGDGMSDGNAFGHFGPLPFGGGCPPPGVWHYEDLTDLAPRWDVSQLIGIGELILPPNTNPQMIPWDLMEMLVSTFPNHKVCSGALVDDSGWTPTAEGVAYYDLLSLGRATWVDRADTAGRGFARGCVAPDHDDDKHDGDCDKDHDNDHEDHDYDHKRRELWGND
jgi:hypothetical protein